MKRWAPFLFVLAIAMALFAEGDIPAYHSAAPPAGVKLPPILANRQLAGPSFKRDYQVHAYELAAKIPKVLYQLPCYCYCDRTGHKSLRTCYESTHAAKCAACMKEAYFAYLETKKGKSPAEIRKGIIEGQWDSIDLESAGSIN